jgi:hypothetical protein
LARGILWWLTRQVQGLLMKQLVLEKAQNRVEATFEGKNSFSILNSFSSQIFVNVASSCGIILGINEEKELDVI